MFSKAKGTPDKNTLKLETETERLLYQKYKEERDERINLQRLVEELTHEVDSLQKQLQCHTESNTKANQPATATGETSTSADQYGTDEEDLARETEWIRTKTRKKRKLNTSPTQDHSKDEDHIKEQTKKPHSPPPIIVDGVKNYQRFFDFISEIIKEETFSVKTLSGDCVKINTNNNESYRSVTKALTDNNSCWHSYENKQERPIRVMAKNLPSSCNTERIQEDLKKKGFQILEAVNKLSWRTKEPLNMFMLTFSNSEDINKIFDIKTIMGCKVEIQAIKTTKLVPQCKRCQAYGHTQKYCSKEPRCVKCTGKHFTKDCTKPRDQKPKCVHCGESHPANYRGCTIAKEMQLLRNKKTKSNDRVLQHIAPSKTHEKPVHNKPGMDKIRPVNKAISYAQVAAKGKPPKAHSFENDQKLDSILNLMLSFDERLKKIETSNRNATTKPRQ